ncbi:hypothetical protein A6R68_13944, partial [Neotoma lepida]
FIVFNDNDGSDDENDDKDKSYEPEANEVAVSIKVSLNHGTEDDFGKLENLTVEGTEVEEESEAGRESEETETKQSMKEFRCQRYGNPQGKETSQQEDGKDDIKDSDTLVLEKNDNPKTATIPQEE